MLGTGRGRGRFRRLLPTVALAWCLVGLDGATAADLDPGLPELRLSLQDAIQAAVDNNVKIKLFNERILEAKGTADTHLGALLPNLSGGVNQRRQTVNLAVFGINLGGLGVPGGERVGPFDIFDSRATFTQNIFSLSLIQRWRAARMGVEVADLEAEITKRDTMAMVGLLYVEALRAEAAVKASAANVELDQQLLRLAQNRKKAGMATGLDVTRAQVQLENEKQRLLVAQNQADRGKLNLIRALGIEFRIRLVLTDELKLVELEPQTVEQALAVAQENRVELAAQARREKLAALSLSSVASERLPSLSANGDYGLIGNRPDQSVGTYTAGVLLSVPVFDGGQREARISEGRSQVRQQQIRTKDVSDQVTLEVRDALLTLASTRQQVSVAEEGLKLAFRELTQARDRFEAGVANNIEVTSAQTSVARARDNVIEALSNFQASRINLARAQGRLETLK